jgi:hypothetical protein
MAKYYAILRKGESEPYVDTSTTSLSPEDALRRARADDADYDTVAKNMPIVGCAVLNELLLERHIF